MFIKNLFNYVGSMIPFLNRTEIQEDIKIKIESFNEHVIPSYLAYTKDKSNLNFKSPISKSLNQKFYKLYKLPKSAPSQNFLFQLNALTNNFRSNLEHIKMLAGTCLEATTATQVAPVKKAAILKAISEMTSCCDFYLSILSYIIDCEMISVSNDENWKTVKAVEDKVQQQFGPFVEAMNVYGGDPKKFADSFAAIPDIVVDSKNVDAMDMIEGNKASSFLDTGANMLQGFLGNPIYHFKMAAVEDKVQRYNRNKEMKKSLELKVMWLSEDFRNNPDPELEAEIQYLNDNINELQYRIDEMEKGN